MQPDDYPAGHFEMMTIRLQEADIERAEKVRAEERKAEAALRAQQGIQGLSDLVAIKAADADVYTKEMDAMALAERNRKAAAAEKIVGRVPPPNITKGAS